MFEKWILWNVARKYVVLSLVDFFGCWLFISICWIVTLLYYIGMSLLSCHLFCSRKNMEKYAKIWLILTKITKPNPISFPAMLLYTLLIATVTLTLTSASDVQLIGDNVCIDQKEENKTVTVTYLQSEDVKEYTWCVAFPPRCPKWTTKMVTRARKKNITRIVNHHRCCKGWFSYKYENNLLKIFENDMAEFVDTFRTIQVMTLGFSIRICIRLSI